MPKCEQCANQAMYEFAGHPLCLHCFHKTQQINNEQHAQLASMINYLSENIRYTMGVSSIPPKLQIPQPAVQNMPVKLTHIDIDNSVVGAVNTGDAVQIDASLNHITMSGNKDIADAMAEFTNELVKTLALQEQARNEVLEQLAFVSSQIATGLGKRTVLKAIMDSIGKTVSTISDLAAIWERVTDLIDKLPV